MDAKKKLEKNGFIIGCKLAIVYYVYYVYYVYESLDVLDVRETVLILSRLKQR